MQDIYKRYGISNDHPAVIEALKHIKMVYFKKEETVLPPYSTPEYLYIIDAGLVKVSTLNKRGEESINLIYGPGEFFPIAWIAKDSKTDAFFVAITDCEIGLLPKAVFMQLLDENPDVTRIVLNKVLELFAAYSARVTNLEFRYGRERVAYRLLMLSARFGKKQGTHTILPPISQHDLGATMNMTRESVNREISRFERLGYITYSRSGITIMKDDKLFAEIGEEQTTKLF